MLRLLAGAVALLFLVGSGRADVLRLAYFDTELSRRGPGLLFKALLSGDDPQTQAVSQVLSVVQPDVLVLAGVDYDADLLTLKALNSGLDSPYPHLFSAMPNTGLPTGRDLDGNGRTGEARDAQGYGWFGGQDGLAVLSRYPFDHAGWQDRSGVLWKDLPDSLIAADDPGFAVQRLSSTVHWLLPVNLPGGALTLGVFKATPPVFDGPEDRNGRRNHDEVTLWRHLMDGPLTAPFVLLGGANLDPDRGEGMRDAIRALLRDPRLTDPVPARAGGGTQTTDWPDPPGRMRVDYVLPSAALAVRGAGVHWPADGPAAALAQAASRHRLVWVDIDWPAPLPRPP
ncbi:endonuclease/exonuclease/phosphatase family protein [Pseudooceanicola aestuarii]|uniref:endonuclease/exonuclease/phosphatase family protein n=1 Tax=Pseudooceanicola aestuarii TaxID=2697319 RepID=UPI001EF993A8|nr:endonuclease/exonuclease/phosphatase family protein [Pseudooceanicola aestuarii]